MKRDSVKALLKYLSASFPNQLEFPKGDKDRDKMIIDTWHDWLKPVKEDTAKVAVKQAAFDNPQWVPSPASILKAVQQLENDYPTPSKAWELARDYKVWKDIDEVPDIVREAIDTYNSHLTGKEDEIPHLRRQFIETYEDVLETKKRNSGLKNYLTNGDEIEKLTSGLEANND